MKILFNYAHIKFYESQKRNTKSGYEVGNFDEVYQFGVKDIDTDFYNKNSHILDFNRGAGYWLWKFYFANKLLHDKGIPDDSYIFYADSGSEFIDSIDKVIEVFDRDKLSVMTYRQNHLSYIFTKRDAFLLTDTDYPEYTHTGARVGGWFLMKKDCFSKIFFSQCLNYGCDHRIITDSPNELGVPNYDGFIENRHDEVVTTLMSKKHKLFPYRNPSQWGYMGDVNLTNNKYGDDGLKDMVEKYGNISSWGDKYGVYFHGESLSQYPNVHIDDRSTYPTILNLHKAPV